ncbi:MAG: hypothetical protein EA416_09425 [Trueperaceae bacterium]|nr:MAG: hypothetical protein EA416_09425 [Trueperaceae bacterium]
MGPRAALFDLAVARADAYARRARVPRSGDAAAIARALEVWHLKTRFAGRVPLDGVAAALALRPEGDGWVWSGGEEGGWVRAA